MGQIWNRLGTYKIMMHGVNHDDVKPMETNKCRTKI